MAQIQGSFRKEFERFRSVPRHLEIIYNDIPRLKRFFQEVHNLYLLFLPNAFTIELRKQIAHFRNGVRI